MQIPMSGTLVGSLRSPLGKGVNAPNCNFSNRAVPATRNMVTSTSIPPPLPYDDLHTGSLRSHLGRNPPSGKRVKAPELHISNGVVFIMSCVGMLEWVSPPGRTETLNPSRRCPFQRNPDLEVWVGHCHDENPMVLSWFNIPTKVHPSVDEFSVFYNAFIAGS
jgi:hypothetical protein